MIEEIEISSLDLRFEDYRIKSRRVEKTLLVSIIENGIREPLQGVVIEDGVRILLDGFKRYRCATKINMNIVPYLSFGSDEPAGIIDLIRISNTKSLNILEQARLIDELQKVHGMSNADIANVLEKSTAWVSLRTGLIDEMSEYVLKRVFDGTFPVYSFMYTLRKFIRINSPPQKDIDDFVKAVSGKGLSIRDIEMLASGYFKGSDDFRKQIREGNITWGLNRLKESPAKTPDCTKTEQRMLRLLESLHNCMQRIIYRDKDDSLNSSAFRAQASLLSTQIINLTDSFTKEVREIHDRCEQA